MNYFLQLANFIGSDKFTFAPEINDLGDVDANRATNVFVLTVLRLKTLSVKNVGETSHLKEQISYCSSKTKRSIACKSVSCALFTPLE